MRLRPIGNANVIFFRRNPANLGNLQEQNATTRFEYNAGEGFLPSPRETLLSRRRSAGKLILRSLNSGPEALDGEGLEQIIDCLRIERAQSILIVRGGEDNSRHRHGLIRGYLLKDCEGVLAWHAHIQKHNLRCGLSQQPKDFGSVCSLAHDRDVGVRSKHRAKEFRADVFDIRSVSAGGSLKRHARMTESETACPETDTLLGLKS